MGLGVVPPLPQPLSREGRGELCRSNPMNFLVLLPLP